MSKNPKKRRGFPDSEIRKSKITHDLVAEPEMISPWDRIMLNDSEVSSGSDGDIKSDEEDEEPRMVKAQIEINYDHPIEPNLTPTVESVFTSLMKERERELSLSDTDSHYSHESLHFKKTDSDPKSEEIQDKCNKLVSSIRRVRTQKPKTVTFEPVTKGGYKTTIRAATTSAAVSSSTSTRKSSRTKRFLKKKPKSPDVKPMWNDSISSGGLFGFPKPFLQRTETKSRAETRDASLSNTHTLLKLGDRMKVQTLFSHTSEAQRSGSTFIYDGGPEAKIRIKPSLPQAARGVSKIIKSSFSKNTSIADKRLSVQSTKRKGTNNNNSFDTCGGKKVVFSFNLEQLKDAGRIVLTPEKAQLGLFQPPHSKYASSTSMTAIHSPSIMNLDCLMSDHEVIDSASLNTVGFEETLQAKLDEIHKINTQSRGEFLNRDVWDNEVNTQFEGHGHGGKHPSQIPRSIQLDIIHESAFEQQKGYQIQEYMAKLAKKKAIPYLLRSRRVTSAPPDVHLDFSSSLVDFRIPKARNYDLLRGGCKSFIL